MYAPTHASTRSYRGLCQPVHMLRSMFNSAMSNWGVVGDQVGKDCYHMDGKAKLPVKWMAPESLIYGEFSQATDMW